MIRFFIPLAALLALASCSQQPVRNFETGQIMKVKMGTVKKVNKFVITRDSEGQGAFAEMASNAASAITPGILAQGTSKIASATGSLMDSKLETVAKVRIRVEIDGDPPKPDNEGNIPEKPPAELVEIIQNDIPGMIFQEGQKVVISSTSTPGNAWPE